MLKNFQSEIAILADQIESEWSKNNYDVHGFPELAKSMLDQFQSQNVPDIESFLNGITSISIPAQTFPRNEFSDFPLTLVRREKFLIDVYIWMQSDTNIHDHHFCGAFKIIKGHSFQVNYTFKKTKELGEGFEEGVMTQLEGHELPLNSTQTIEPWDKFIHHVFHLQQPTITLCVRTDFFPEKSLSSYIYPKFKLTQSPLTLVQMKWLRVLKLAILNGNVPTTLPYDNSEILNILYSATIGRVPLTPEVIDFLKAKLETDNYANGFFELINKQQDMNLKLKTFGMAIIKGAQ
jgi:hypothetical protein